MTLSIRLFATPHVYYSPDDGAGSAGAGSGAPAGGGGAGAGSGSSAAGSGGASSTGGAGGTGDPAGAGARPGGDPNARPGGGTNAPGAGGGAAAKQYTYGEDRSDWLPRHRFNDVNGRYETEKQRADRLQAMLEAGTGVRFQPQEPEEVSEAREAFFTLFPKLRALEQLDPNQLSALLQSAPGLQASHAMMWEARGHETLRTVQGEVAKAMGLDSLQPRQSKAIGAAFINFLEGDPAMLQRYERNDPGVIKVFVDQYTEDFIHPFRRSGESQGINRARQNGRLPSAPGGSGSPAGGGRSNGPRSEDEVHDAALAAFKAAAG